MRFKLRAPLRVAQLSGALALAGDLSIPTTLTGLDFPSNEADGSDIRIVFNGANLVSRLNQTVLWKDRYRQQNGYQAVTWNSPNTGTWDFGAYSVGMHGYPCQGVVNSAGQSMEGGTPGGTGSTGTVQYAEIAGLLISTDYIASPASPGPQSTFQLVDGAWRSHARIIAPNGSNTDHFHYPDLGNRPTEFIKQSVLTADIASGGSNPAFYFGASDWTGNGNSNTETISGILRGLAIWAPAITNMTHIVALSALDTDAEVLAYCAAHGLATPHYLNMNPTPSDVSDKSGSGHSPSWANSNRPSLWTS